MNRGVTHDYKLGIWFSPARLRDRVCACMTIAASAARSTATRALSTVPVSESPINALQPRPDLEEHQDELAQNDERRADQDARSEEQDRGQGSSDRLVAPGCERRVTPNGGIVLRPNIKRDDREHRSCRVRVDRPPPGAARHAGRLL